MLARARDTHRPCSTESVADEEALIEVVSPTDLAGASTTTDQGRALVDLRPGHVSSPPAQAPVEVDSIANASDVGRARVNIVPIRSERFLSLKTHRESPMKLRGCTTSLSREVSSESCSHPVRYFSGTGHKRLAAQGAEPREQVTIDGGESKEQSPIEPNSASRKGRACSSHRGRGSRTIPA